MHVKTDKNSHTHMHTRTHTHAHTHTHNTHAHTHTHTHTTHTQTHTTHTYTHTHLLYSDQSFTAGEWQLRRQSINIIQQRNKQIPAALNEQNKSKLIPPHITYTTSAWLLKPACICTYPSHCKPHTNVIWISWQTLGEVRQSEKWEKWPLPTHTDQVCIQKLT